MSKLYFEREIVQLDHPLHEFYNGDDGYVLVQAPTPLQAILAWAKVVDMDPDELSNFYEGKKYLVICDQDLNIPVDEVINLNDLGYSIMELMEPQGVVVAYKGEVPPRLDRPSDPRIKIRDHGMFIYRAK